MGLLCTKGMTPVLLYILQCYSYVFTCSCETTILGSDWISTRIAPDKPDAYARGNG